MAHSVTSDDSYHCQRLPFSFVLVPTCQPRTGMSIRFVGARETCQRDPQGLDHPDVDVSGGRRIASGLVVLFCRLWNRPLQQQQQLARNLFVFVFVW